MPCSYALIGIFGATDVAGCHIAAAAMSLTSLVCSVLQNIGFFSPRPEKQETVETSKSANFIKAVKKTGSVVKLPDSPSTPLVVSLRLRALQTTQLSLLMNSS